jgi:hypothetical protein
METFEQTQDEHQEQTSSDPALSSAVRAGQNQHPYSAPDVQRTLGNRALGRWLQSKAQAQAPVADDASELETERVAERVMNAQPHGLPTDAAARTAVTAREPLIPRGGGEALPARILDRFDADKSFTRYPKWLRYMVIHFSGMRYKSAHGSYAPATEIVKRLKGEQVRSETARVPEDEMAGLAGQAALDVEAELGADDKPKRKRARALKSRLTALKAVETTEAAAFTKKGQAPQRAAFEELLKLEAERDRLQSQLDAKKFTEADAVGARKVIGLLEPHIKEAEAKTGSASLKQVRKRIDDAEDRRRAAVVEHEVEKAEAALAGLDDTQAIAVLKVIRAKGLFPEWVWRELVRVTALKLEVEEVEDWEEVTPEEREWKKKRNTVSDRWRVIMKEWKKDVTGWRKRHGEDLSLVVIRAVCNEIAEMSLHARGVKPTGGISQKARWYAAEGSGRSFSRPKSNADLKTGASFFFLEWSDKPPRNKVNVVRSDTVELQNEKGELISDGFKDADGWEYEFDADNRVKRRQLIRPPGRRSICTRRNTSTGGTRRRSSRWTPSAGA